MCISCEQLAIESQRLVILQFLFYFIVYLNPYLLRVTKLIKTLKENSKYN